MKNRNLRFALMMLLSAFIFVTTVSAQEISISGKVVDKDTQEPLPGVSIAVEGTTTGTITNIDGIFNLSAPTGVTLVFSYIGYSNHNEVVTAGTTTLNVELSVSTLDLDQVIVIGYGSVKKKDATGSVATVKTEDFNRGVTTSPNDLIQGRVSGLMVTNSSGDPGASSTIRIRGNSSVRAGNDPLFVVDGVPLSGGNTSSGTDIPSMGGSDARNPLNFINPNDIASMDVLKDASATAIYGSRGANGVIIITTKKGSKGQTRVSYNASFSTASIANQIPLYNASEFTAIAPNQNQGGNADAMDAILRQTFSNNQNVAFSGGSEDLNYRLSLSSQNQEGIIKNSGLKKYTSNLNVSHEFFKDRLTVDVNMITSSINDSFAPVSNNAGYEGDIVSSALNWNPTRNFIKEDGSYDQFSNENSNPLALLDYIDDSAQTLRILSNFSASLEITDGLVYKFNFGLDRTTSTRSTELSSKLNRQDVLDRGYAGVSDLNTKSQLLEHTLSYNKMFNDNIRFDALLGYSYQTFDRDGKGISGRDFEYSDVSYINQLQSISQDTRNVWSYMDPTTELQSYFGRVNMSMYDKILVTATMRADGSSKFGKNNKYGFFPSVALGYRISEEDFIPDTFDDLKIRLGWGQTGNQEFPSGASQEQYSITKDGLTRTQFDNPDLKWETSTTYNAGIDFVLFDNKLSGSIEYFNKSTKDLLFNAEAALPGPSGTRRWTNLDANVKNTGVEISLNATIVDQNDWRFELGGNVSFINNILEGFSGVVETGGLHGQGMSGTTVQRFVAGQPLNVFYTLEFQGLDADGLGVYSPEKGYFGDPNPSTIIGANARLSYKSWDLNANLNGAYGHYVYNNTGTSVLVASNPSKGRNTSPEYTLPGENVSNAIKGSTRYLEKGNYLRLNNLTLGYTVKNAPIFFETMRFTLTGQNLFVITKFTGFDPEVNVNKAVDGVPSYGIEYTPYPTARTFTFGLNVTF